MNIEQAKNLKQGDYIHHVSKTNSDGSPMRARVTSVKTWKRSPDKVEVRYKRGLYEFGVFNERELDQIEPGEGR